MRTKLPIPKDILDSWAIEMRGKNLRDVEAGSDLSYHTVRDAIINELGTPETIKRITDYLTPKKMAKT